MDEVREPALGEVVAGATVVAIDHDRKTYTTRERGVQYWCPAAEEADRKELVAAMAKHEANFLIDYVRAAGPAELVELNKAARMEREVAAYRRGKADERAAVVAWLRSLDRLELAKHIDQCAHTDEE